MKFLLQTRIIIFCVCNIWTFQQNLYTLVFERTEVVRFNATYVQTQIRTSKYNRTYTIINASYNLMKDLGYDTKIQVQAYKLASNEYRLFPLRFMFDLCTALNNNDYGLKRSLRCGNFTGCPLKKGRYLVCNFAPDATKFPPLIPAGNYMLELGLIYHDMEIALIKAYGTVTYPIV